MSEPLWPPKPKLFDIVGAGSHSRGSPRTKSTGGKSGSSAVTPSVGGIERFCMDNTIDTASIAPAAPNEWPVTPLIEFIAGPGSVPKTSATADASAASLSEVEVPWAFT